MRRVFIELFLMEPEDVVELAKRLDLGAEIFLTVSRMEKFSETRIRELYLKRRDLAGFSIHGPYKDLVPGSIDPRIRQVTKERFLEVAEIAKKLDSEWIVLHLNFLSQIYGHEKLRKVWLEYAIRVFSELETFNIPIFLENSYEGDPTIFLDVLTNLDTDIFAMCFDIGHAYAYSDVKLEKWVEVLSSFIREVHVHETKRGQDLHLPLGSGYIDINKILSSIESNVGGGFIITLEPSSIEDLHKNLEWLRENGWIH